MATFIRAMRIWFAMLPSAFYMANKWFPTYAEYKAHIDRVKKGK